MTPSRVIQCSFAFFLLLPAIYLELSDYDPSKPFPAVIFASLIAVGSALIGQILFSRIRQSHTYAEITATPFPVTTIGAKSILPFFLFLASVCLLYLIDIGKPPLFSLVSGTLVDPTSAREESFKTVQSPFRSLYFFTRDSFIPFGACVLSVILFRKRTTLWYRIILILFLLFCSFFGGMSLARLPMVAPFFCFVLAMFLSSHLSVVRLFSRALLLLIPVIVLPGIAMHFSFNLNIEDVYITIFERIVVAPANIASYYFEIFPADTPFLHGSGMGIISEFSLGHQVDVGNIVYHYIVPTGIESGSANGAFFCGLYADFNWIGVFFGSLLLSLFIGIQDQLVRHSNSIVVGFGVFSCYQTCLLTSMPIASCLIYSGLPFIAFCIWLSLPRTPNSQKRPRAIQATFNE